MAAGETSGKLARGAFKRTLHELIYSTPPQKKKDTCTKLTRNLKRFLFLSLPRNYRSVLGIRLVYLLDTHRPY